MVLASLDGGGNLVATERRGTCTPPLISGLVNLLCGAANFGKIWSAGEQHEIKYTNEVRISVRIIMRVTVLAYLSIH